MTTPLIDRKRVPSFGECIYCARRPPEVRLTDEHVIPFSLGGNFIITDGSCTDCADVTKKLEDHVANRTWKIGRIHIGEQSRNKKKKPWPEVLPAVAKVRGEVKRFELPIQDHPYFFPMPVWGLPGLLLGESPSKKFAHEKAHVFYYVPQSIRRTLDLKDGEMAEIPFPEFRIDSDKFARAIAKIAYCHLVATRGLFGFRRLILPDLILGRYPYVPYFVGSEFGDPPPPLPKNVKHSISIVEHQRGALRLLVGHVRLYANSGTDSNGMPTYYVVLGAPRRDAPKYQFMP